MAALDFPASPTNGQVFVGGNGVTYTWNGTLWLASGASAGGDFMASHSGLGGVLGGAAATIVWNTVQLGNANGEYSVSTGRYTPPAGRYCLFTEISGTLGAAGTILQLSIRKNGVAIGNDVLDQGPAGSQWANPCAQVLVDANGTDWFDVTGLASAGVTKCSGRFLAYPISGIKGPPGDPATGIDQNAQTGSYTLVLSDAGKHLYHAAAAATATYTIPANASVAFPVGTIVTFMNDSTNAVTIAITTDVLAWSPTGGTGSRTLAQYGQATALKVTSTRWVLNGTGLT